MPIGSPNAGYRLFTTGEVLTAAQVQYNLQNQTIMYFGSAALRDAALTVGTVQEGMFAYLADTDSVTFYNGASWVTLSTGGDLTAITAGNGITVTNGTGPVPTIAISTGAALTSPEEVFTTSGTAANGAINIDTLTSAVSIRTTSASGAYTLNVRGDATTTLDSLMAVNSQVSVVFESPNGVTPYYPTTFSVDGTLISSPNIKWLGAVPVAGNASATDVYVYTIRKTGAGTFTVLASQSKFVA
jgi:hypothetical protein